MKYRPQGKYSVIFVSKVGTTSLINYIPREPLESVKEFWFVVELCDQMDQSVATHLSLRDFVTDRNIKETKTHGINFEILYWFDRSSTKKESVVKLYYEFQEIFYMN